MAKISEDKELNRIDQAYKDLLTDYKEHKAVYRTAFVACFLFAVVLTSFLGQYWNVFIRKQDKIYLLNLFTEWFSNPIYFILTLIIFVSALYLFRRTRKLMEKDYIQIDDDGDNFLMAKETALGGAHFQNETEMSKPNPNLDGEVLCLIDKDYYAHTGDILGKTKDGKIVSRIPGLHSINDNKLGIGASRSGKSAAGVINDLMQAMRRGESIICTDTKGDLYRKTKSVFSQNGYLVKVINLKPDELKHSDGWEVMKYISEEDNIQADVIANAMITNTLNGTKKDYWAEQEEGLLKSIILLVATSPVYEGKRSFAEVIKIIKAPSSIEAKFAGLPEENPAKTGFDNFMQAEPKNRGQIVNGLGNRLRLLKDKYVQEIVSNDEVDLILPMKRKCIYYIIISDTDTTLKFVASMFFIQALQAQCNYHDSLSSKKKKESLRVLYEIDEAKAIGTIPDFDIKISTFASRGIHSTLFFQDIGQLMDTYPGKTGKGWHDIVANSSIKTLFAAGDIETAKFFETLIGDTTVKMVNGTYGKGRAQILDAHDDENMRDSFNKRPLLPAAQALHLNRNRLVIVIDGHQPIKLYKYLGDLWNPIYTELSTETPPNRHKPKWRKQKEEHAKEVEEQLKKLSDSDKLTVESEEEEKKIDARKNDRISKAMTITFDNGDEVDPDTGEVVNAYASKKKVKRVPDVFDDMETIKEPRRDIKKKVDVPPPKTGKEIVSNMNSKSTKGDDILGDLF